MPYTVRWLFMYQDFCTTMTQQMGDHCRRTQYPIHSENPFKASSLWHVRFSVPSRASNLHNDFHLCTLTSIRSSLYLIVWFPKTAHLLVASAESYWFQKGQQKQDTNDHSALWHMSLVSIFSTPSTSSHTLRSKLCPLLVSLIDLVCLHYLSHCKTICIFSGPALELLDKVQGESIRTRLSCCVQDALVNDKDYVFKLFWNVLVLLEIDMLCLLHFVLRENNIVRQFESSSCLIRDHKLEVM